MLTLVFFVCFSKTKSYCYMLIVSTICSYLFCYIVIFAVLFLLLLFVAHRVVDLTQQSIPLSDECRGYCSDGWAIYCFCGVWLFLIYSHFRCMFLVCVFAFRLLFCFVSVCFVDLCCLCCIAELCDFVGFCFVWFLFFVVFLFMFMDC